MSQSVKLSGGFLKAWAGSANHHAQSGNFEAIWGDASTRSSHPPKIDRSQVVSRQTNRAVGPGVSSEHYLSHSQGSCRSGMVGCRLALIGAMARGRKRLVWPGRRSLLGRKLDRRSCHLGLGYLCGIPVRLREGQYNPSTLGNLVCPVKSMPILQRG